MKVNVKILQGAECNVDVTHGDSVETLKVIFYLHCIISRKTVFEESREESMFSAGAGEGPVEHQS